MTEWINLYYDFKPKGSSEAYLVTPELRSIFNRASLQMDKTHPVLHRVSSLCEEPRLGNFDSDSHRC